MAEKIRGRELKKIVLEFLCREDFESNGLEKILQLPLKPVINAIFSFLCNQDETIKWRAVTAMGAAVSALAENDIESARVVMRRLMWSLNDESGGIGWGSPEAMSEIMARSRRLADEYYHILVSYSKEDGNFLEHKELQEGVLWGLKRLAKVRPELIQQKP